MKTSIHFLSYLAEFSLEWEMFQTEAVEKIKTHILCSITFFFLNSCRLWDNVEKYCSAGQATDDNMVLALPCWITNKRKTKAINSHSDCVILIAFPRQQWLHERSTVSRYMYVACLVRCLHMKQPLGLEDITALDFVPRISFSCHMWNEFKI